MEKDVNESQLALSHAMAKPQTPLLAFQLQLNSALVRFILVVILALVKGYIFVTNIYCLS